MRPQSSTTAIPDRNAHEKEHVRQRDTSAAGVTYLNHPDF